MVKQKQMTAGSSELVFRRRLALRASGKMLKTH